MINMPLEPRERDVLVGTLDEYLEESKEVLGAIYQDKSIDEPEEFLAVVNDQQERITTLETLREKLANA
jgi:hypothetical protein